MLEGWVRWSFLNFILMEGGGRDCGAIHILMYPKK